MSKANKTVHGYFWHIDCVYRDEAGGRRRDDGGDTKKGDFVKRAITIGEARHVDPFELPVCHWCVKHNRDPREGDRDDYIVVSYELGAGLCDCGEGISAANHNRDSVACERVWMLRPKDDVLGSKNDVEGEEVRSDRYICGECWYKDNDMPPDEREDRPDGANCQSCDDYVTSVIYIPGTNERTNVVQNYDDDPDEYTEDTRIRFNWTRRVTYVEYFSIVLDDLDEHELDMLNEGDTDGFIEMLHDVAHDESDDGNRIEQEWWGYGDDCPEDLDWEVI